MDNIRPSSDLRNKYNEMSKLCKETREPVFLTVNGHGDTVLMGIDDYYRMKDELDLLRMLAESEEDVKQGRTKSFDDVYESLRKKLLENAI